MTQHDFTALYKHYPAIIKRLPATFGSHQFILALAHQHQKLYIEALYAYRHNPAPFQAVHTVLVRRLRSHPELISYTPGSNVPSTDIFGHASECAEWRKCS